VTGRAPRRRPCRRTLAGAAESLAVLLLLTGPFLIAAAAALGTIPASAAASLDDRVYAIARQLMCPVCAGQTVADSDAAVAREMRAAIREKLIAGEAPEQILREFVAQFGEGVLAEPPRRGFSLLLYLGPAAALVLGLGLAALYIRRWAAVPPAPAPGPPAPDPADLGRLARDLEAHDQALKD